MHAKAREDGTLTNYRTVPRARCARRPPHPMLQSGRRNEISRHHKDAPQRVGLANAWLGPPVIAALVALWRHERLFAAQSYPPGVAACTISGQRRVWLLLAAQNGRAP